MSLEKTFPIWAPDAVATDLGWCNPRTKEVYVSIKKLKTRLEAEQKSQEPVAAVVEEVKVPVVVIEPKVVAPVIAPIKPVAPVVPVKPVIAPVAPVKPFVQATVIKHAVAVQVPVIKEEIKMVEQLSEEVKAKRAYNKKPTVLGEVVEEPVGAKIIGEVVEYAVDAPVIGE